jgi:phage tail-like protein
MPEIPLPNIPNLPNIPLPNIPGLPSLPSIPSLPNIPGVGGLTLPSPPRPGVRATKPGSKTPDPTGERGFHVKAGDLTVGFFMECTGLTLEFELMPYEEGGENTFVHQLRGRLKYPNLVLKRGITHEDGLFKWFMACRDEVQRKEITVTLIGPDGVMIRGWSFRDGFPVKWQGPNLNASSSSVATETLEIAHRGLTPGVV